MDERLCAICGKPFLPKNKKHKYCGFECVTQANRIAARKSSKKALEKKRAQREKYAVCPICGVRFERRSQRQKYCGSAECTRERMRRYSRARWANDTPYENLTKKPEKPKKPKIKKDMTIGEIAAEARKMGLSYGQYVGMYM